MALLHALFYLNIGVIKLGQQLEIEMRQVIPPQDILY